MKHLLNLIFISIISIVHLHAQVPPQAFNYSGVARDVASVPIANTTIGIQFNILKNSATGASQYIENHVATTDDFGLFNLIVGSGAVQSGSMSAIDWSSDDFYLTVGMDANGGTNFLTMGTTQLLSVPYALHAGTAGNGIDRISANGDTLFLSNGQFFLSGGGSSGLNLPTLTTSLDTSSSGYFIAGGDIVNANGNQIVEKGIVYSQFPNPVINQSIQKPMGSGNGLFSDTIYNFSNANAPYYLRAYAITQNNNFAYGNELVFNGYSTAGSDTYDGFADGSIQIALTQTDTTFTNLPVSTHISQNATPGSVSVALDISSMLGAAPGTLVPEVDGTLSGTTITITNQTYVYQGILTVDIDGFVYFDATFDNILNTTNLTFSNGAVGNISFDGVLQP